MVWVGKQKSSAHVAIFRSVTKFHNVINQQQSSVSCPDASVVAVAAFSGLCWCLWVVGWLVMIKIVLELFLLVLI